MNLTLKRMMAVLVALMLLAAFPASAEEEGRITYQELKERMDSSASLNLFDLRSDEAYDAGHIPGASCVPLDTLQATMQSILDDGFSYMDVSIIVYGDTAQDAAAAVEIFRSLGFTNVVWLEGVSAWEESLMTTQEEMDDQMHPMRALNTLDLYGEQVDSSLLSGYKLTMVNIWATYCNPCISEMGDLGKLAEEMKEQSVQIVGLISDAVDPTTLAPVEKKLTLAQEIVKATGANYPHLLPSMELTQKILVYIDAVPTTFFVDENGAIIGGLYVGARDYSAWKTIIEDTLGKLP